MDGDLSAALESVLSDPEKMEKAAAMAKELFGGGPAPSAPGPEGTGESAQAAPAPAAGPEASIMAALGKAMARGGMGNSRSTALLTAMRPYMRPEKQEKLDRAMQIARMANIAGAVMKEYGGGGHGL